MRCAVQPVERVSGYGPPSGPYPSLARREPETERYRMLYMDVVAYRPFENFPCSMGWRA